MGFNNHPNLTSSLFLIRFLLDSNRDLNSHRLYLYYTLILPLNYHNFDIRTMLKFFREKCTIWINSRKKCDQDHYRSTYRYEILASYNTSDDFWEKQVKPKNASLEVLLSIDIKIF